MTWRRGPHYSLLLLFAFVLTFLLREAPTPGQSTNVEAELQLGARLFDEERFSTPRGDLPASCSHCHLFDQDPQGLRAFTEFLSRSWMSARMADPRRNELRNSPTLFDVAAMPRLHFDGEFSSLEQLVKGTLAGRPMGWLAGEESAAFDHLRSVLISDAGSGRSRRDSYRDQFRQVYGVDISKLDLDRLIELTARAISNYMRTFASKMTSPYDQFINANGLPRTLEKNEPASQFGARLLKQISDLESRRALKLPKGFPEKALAGLKIFMATEASVSNGNCVSCHAPPLFTDFSFHNIGISQSEYEGFHGEGSFAKLAVPGPETTRPVTRLRETPSRQKPGEADLGHWNFVDLQSSPLRRTGETSAQFLQRMIATFKTPTLRHLAFSQPYMHTGMYVTLEDALAELMRMSEMARDGHVREADQELPRIRISRADIPPLVSFLEALNETLSPTVKPSK